jgi:hypothetical protein
MSASLSTFILQLHHGIWHVTLDGSFFGDYRSEGGALEAIAEAQGKLSAPAKVIRSDARDRL